MRIANIVGIGCGLIFLALAYIQFTARSRIQRVKMTCLTRLVRTGEMFFRFSEDHQGLLPSQISTNQGGVKESIEIEDQAWKHFKAAFRGEFSSEVLACPSDSRKPVFRWNEFANANLSYFVNSSAPRIDSPDLILSGDRNISEKTNQVDTLTPDTIWHPEVGLHGSEGYLLLGDGSVIGSVRRITSADLRAHLRNRKAGS
jgi:hypothetical protein